MAHKPRKTPKTALNLLSGTFPSFANKPHTGRNRGLCCMKKSFEQTNGSPAFVTGLPFCLIPFPAVILPSAVHLSGSR